MSRTFFGFFYKVLGALLGKVYIVGALCRKYNRYGQVTVEARSQSLSPLRGQLPLHKGAL